MIALRGSATAAIAAVRLHPYALPLVRPWTAAAATLNVRRGTLVELVFDDGLTGWGDCAPLPSSGTLGQTRAFAALSAFAAARPGDQTALPTTPEAAWAVETARLDAAARRHGLPLARFLRADAQEGVAINAALGAAVGGGAVKRAEAALDHGYSVAKLKLGVADIAAEIAAVRAIAAHTGHRLRLRLDANRAWTPSQAMTILDALADLPIDGLEEPLAAPTLAALAALQSRTAFALAIDESLPVFGLKAVLAAAAVRRLVIKPARLGGFTATWTLAHRAIAVGIEVVLTSVVDSTIGVTAAAHLAAALPGNAIHGLGTLPWLAFDVALPPRLDAGILQLPAGCGLGVRPTGFPATLTPTVPPAAAAPRDQSCR